ncbi:MAG: DUF1080 domain-containing protein [Saprospiraceae bacterium]|nr:DUF1080 domain-containing protein [Saprospiraceae bacterium]
MKNKSARVFICCLWSVLSVVAATAQLPAGFKSLWNGKNLKGWHLSRSSHQGTTADFKLENGILVAGQNPFGQGGVLLTDKEYKDFEFYLEVKIDSFTNGGIFLRSNEGGAAYQIELALPGGCGDLIGERIGISVPGRAATRDLVWKKEDWNSFRIRMTGDVPNISVWINDRLMYEVRQTKNDFIAQSTSGKIGLQCHWTSLYSTAAQSELMPLDSWRPGAVQRFRNIGIKKL